MAEEIDKLLGVLFDEKATSSSNDIRLRSEKLGLERLYLILKQGVEISSDGKLGLQRWDQAQIQAVISVAYAIVSSIRSISVEQVEPIIVAVMEQSLEFALCCLEKSVASSDDLCFIQLLEIALVDGTIKEADVCHPSSLNSLVDSLKSITLRSENIDLQDHIECIVQGNSCSKEKEPVDRLLMTLASEWTQNEIMNSWTNGRSSHDFNKLVPLLQHWAVVHLGCIHRLVSYCTGLFENLDKCDEKIDGINLRKRLSFSTRICKLLASVTKDAPYVEYDAKLLGSFATFANGMPSLLGSRYEFSTSNVSVEFNIESLVLLMLEAFLNLVHTIFCNSNVFQNMLVCVIVSVFENLDVDVWRYDKSITNIKLPVAYFPRIVLYILKLVEDIKKQQYQALELKGLHTGNSGSSADGQVELFSCGVGCGRISLVKKYTVEELLKVIFPTSKQWVDNLMHLALFLHSEGVKMLPKLDRSYSSCTKASSTLEPESTVCHEDEALFGDLFSEGGRSVGSTDGFDQSVIAVSSVSNLNMPLQAATELFIFLKTSAFAPEWSSSIYEDACKKLTSYHIDIMLSVLSCQGCYTGDRTSDAGDRKFIHTHPVCYELLHNLISFHALSDSLEEYLVCKILTVEDGSFVYNHQTLALLAHTLICRVGLSGNHLRTKVQKVFVEFVFEKVKSVCACCPSLKELIEMLPSVFHIEILLMSFHLSSEEEKAVQANFIFSSLKTVELLSDGFNSTQLSCWAMLVSRLILILRHMIFYPNVCPPTLLSELKSKLREAPLARSVPMGNASNHMFWVSTFVENVMRVFTIEGEVSSNFLNQLIDVTSFTASACKEDVAVECLGLNWAEVCSSFSWILGFWRGKEASTVEDLVLERYIFMLCWDIPPMHNTLDLLTSDLQTLDITSTEHLLSWYDVPFTVAESLLADEEITISIGPTFNRSMLPRIDTLEIYGRAKDEFGWKEKMDAVLDMEARVLGSSSWVAGSGKKSRTGQAAPIEEQVVADGLNLLSRLYSLWKPEFSSNVEEVNAQLSKLKCKQLLETIFESDREPLLQAGAFRVLQAVFPKKEIYYQVKDTMRLLGVVKSTSTLLSRLGIGGSTSGWIIEEFTAQMHAVSKIALHRRSNLATFLETHGSEVVDGLMQVLWGILDIEQPETQTMNTIVVASVDLIYSYAECLVSHEKDAGVDTVAPAVSLFKKLLFSQNEAVQTSSSLAISSRLLQVPFPKQTMLGTDDSVDSSTSAPARADVASSTGGNARVMVEEDSITSSVQYCCDGCSTVPILRRRWHCTVCPDFDLCEACYEMLDADRLPPPHSRDHPMSAIPIEVETYGGEGNEMQFSADDLSDPMLLPVASDVGMQTSAPAIHVLETNESEEFLSSVTDPVTISASKRAINSLILSEFLKLLKGWMETTSGVRAIPVMQLFYRLSSAVGGPFVDSSRPETLDLEKLIKWFLEEISIDKAFAAKSRSSFGEVTILVFMFFILMLRNWHQPGGDGSLPKPGGSTDSHDKSTAQIPSSAPVTSSSAVDDQEKNSFHSQLLRACGSLRQQEFIDYLMDILQQLMHVFKSTSVGFDSSHGANSGSGCGALLTVRREIPAGNFSPFFSDSYAKSHRSDMFADYHRLLLENTFRLVYSLVRPEKHEKSVEKDKFFKIPSGKDLKLDGYQDVLCSYINNANTTFVRRYARRLFLHLCGSKTHYYNVRDSWQFSSEVKHLYKHINKSGGFQTTLSYERSVKIVKSLSTMAEVASSRPRNWQKYCLRHGDVLRFLVNGVFYFPEECVSQALKLLNLSFYNGKDISLSLQKVDGSETVTGTSSSKSGSQPVDLKKKKKGDDGMESGLDKSCMDMEPMVDIFADKGYDVLRQFVDCFLLEWNSSSVRVEAKCVLYGAWHHGKQSFKETMLTILLEKINFLPMYGQNIMEYTELVTCLLGKVPDNNTKQQNNEIVDRCLTPDVIKCIFDTLHLQNELLANHPNSRIYNTLSGLVEFDGYYLESEPCVACSCPELPYSRMKLESLKSETKFTDNRIIVKCTGSYTIQSVTMNVHDARKSKSVKVLNLYYNNRPVSDLAELKNNWSLWKRAKICHLAFNQTELKVDFPIPITACNFMIELDSFYENLQALSLEPLQCPRCSRPVTDRHGICGNCHENAYQCRQCRNINYENLDSFLCNECGYSKYGRFEFNFMAKPSFTFDNMENDDDMKKGLAAIESESENAHRRYQQLLGFKKPLLKIVSSIGDNDMDSQQKDSVQQMMVSLPGPSCKINRKIALLGVLYGEKCKAAFDSVSKSVQTLQGLRRVLMNYLHQRHSDDSVASSRLVVSRSPNSCYGCATVFVTQCLEMLQVLSKHPSSKKQLVAAGILSELFENNIHQGPKTARVQARAALCAFSEGDKNAVSELNALIQKKVMYCLEHHRSMDIALATREELLLLSEVCSLADEFWESRLRVVFQLLFSSIKLGAKHPSISEHVILPCLRIISQACTPPKPDSSDKEQGAKSSPAPLQKDENSLNPSKSVGGSKSVPEASEKNWDGSQKTHDIQLLSYSEWEKGASYLDFVRRHKVSQATRHGQRSRPQRYEFLALKYALRWKRRSCRTGKSEIASFELGSWVTELVLSACSQSIRSEMCMLISLLCAQSSSRRFRLLNLLMSLLPATLSAGENAAEYFELLFKMIETEDARLFLTVRGCLTTICKLITQEVSNVESLERSLRIDISQGFILHKLIELLGKFLDVPNIRSRFMREQLLSEVLEALIVVRGLIVQKTKLISDCSRLLKDLLDSLLLESAENKKHFIQACIGGLLTHGEDKRGRSNLFILEQLCNLICPSKPEAVYHLILNKAHTQEEFIRGSMTKNPYSSAEIGPLMRDVKNKICNQLDLLGLIEDDYGMELLVAGNIISLDLSIAQVYEQVWKKSSSQSTNTVAAATLLSSAAATSARDSPPMTVTYRLQGLDGEATEPMIKELDEDREESQDPEVEFAIAGAVRECGGLEILLEIVQRSRDDLKSNQEQLVAVLNLLMHCCKIRENRRALLRLGALSLLLEIARRAFSVDAIEPAEGILLIVESLTMEANESDNINIAQNALTVSNEEAGAGEQAKKIVLMFLERLSHPTGLKKSSKQQRNTEMVARILPYLTYGEPAAMEALVQHFDPYLKNWVEFDQLQKQYLENPKDESFSLQALKQRFAVENFVRVSESMKTSSCGERLKDIILETGITGVAVRHLKESFVFTGEAGFKSSPEWSLGLKLSSVPLILSMLRGLSMGHLATQKCVDEGGILPLLHALEGVTGENDIGARAENLLDTLSDKEGQGDGFLAEKVRALRHATRDEMRRRALVKRKELLQGLGMRQELASDGGKRIVVAQPILEGLDDMEEEEDGLACMVCREGYSLRPTDLLGVYTFSKRVNLGVGTSGSARGDCVYTTVSHFNIIHFQCHQEAKRADAALRNPKKEWDGAALRNNETLCNNLYPIRGPVVPLPQYTRYVDQYWDYLNGLGRADGSRLRLLTYDIVLMLARFATGASFSTDSRGGGKESNAKFLPFMIQMARYFVDHDSSQRNNLAKSVATYLASSTSTSTPDSKSPTSSSSGTEETVQFMMVSSLLSESYESWLQHRRAFLQRGIYHAYMQRTHAKSSHRSSSSSSSSTPSTPSKSDATPEKLLSIIQPMLVYTGLIEQLQRYFKVQKKGAGQTSEKDEKNLEGWELLMKEKLLDVKELVGFSKEMLSWLEDMTSATDLQEAFDVIGVLADVMSSPSGKCEDFVYAAIEAGKSSSF
ncbi:hypothetical protein SSX86_014479 [Deinandra increscens subsp. villosa]|uniref:Auxin transport protein BIG n=1 Tax=Deinandra increscens subsp. villosa TaxID=3103831 RepID=A0AAP0GZV0_9ASTR